VKIGKKLKKNNVAVDVMCFGDLDEENMAKIEAFVGAVNSNDNSHLVTVPTGAALVDCMLSCAHRPLHPLTEGSLRSGPERASRCFPFLSFYIVPNDVSNALQARWVQTNGRFETNGDQRIANVAESLHPSSSQEN
jgi:hypothetical protein